MIWRLLDPTLLVAYAEGRGEGHAILNHQMLHFHTHDFQPVHNQFGFPL